MERVKTNLHSFVKRLFENIILKNHKMKKQSSTYQSFLVREDTKLPKHHKNNHYPSYCAGSASENMN
jgi:hypothetical protein